MNTIDFTLRGEVIALDALLKATGVVASGGMAKTLIQGGAVSVDGEIDTRRTGKLRAGQVVQLGDIRIQLIAAVD